MHNSTPPLRKDDRRLTDIKGEWASHLACLPPAETTPGSMGGGILSFISPFVFLSFSIFDLIYRQGNVVVSLSIHYIL